MGISYKYQVVILLLILMVRSSNSWSEYCKLSCGNTKNFLCIKETCAPSEACGCQKEYEMTTYLRNQIISEHNRHRNEIALGKVGNYGTAANMRALSYSLELEYIARCFIRMCSYTAYENYENYCAKSKKFGETNYLFSMWKTSAKTVFDRKVIAKTVNFWLRNELPEVTQEKIKKYPYAKENSNRTSIFHFAVGAWANTYAVGCSNILFYSPDLSYSITMLCSYGPKGLYPEEPIFEIGKPASNCPKGFPPHKQYPGLCGNETILDRSFKMKLVPKKKSRCGGVTLTGLGYWWTLYALVVLLTCL